VKTVRMILSAALIATVLLLFSSLPNSSGATFLTGAQRIGVNAADFPGSAPTPGGNRWARDFADGNSHANESILQALLGLGMIAFSSISMRARRRRDS
jgi:hypothetical protein